MWTEHRTKDNVPYWYNSATGVSVWRPPSDLGGTISASSAPTPRLTHNMAPPAPPRPRSDHISVGAVIPPGTAPSLPPSTPFPSQHLPVTLSAPPPVGSDPRPPPYLALPARQPILVPKEAPVSMKPVPTSTWFVVLTSYGGEFYFNAKTSSSVWEPPEDLTNALEIWKRSDTLALAVGLKRPLDSATEVSDKKRSKQSNAEGTELTEDDIAYQLKCMKEEGALDDLPTEEAESEEEDEAATNGQNEIRNDPPEEPTKPNRPNAADMSSEQKSIAFKRIFWELDISPFAVWDKELPRIIHDWRYTLVSTLKDRKQLFDEYCQERAVELRNEKKSKQKFALDDYQSALAEYFKGLDAARHPRFDNFQRKFKRDARFSSFADSKERERVFKQYAKEIGGRSKNGTATDNSRIDDSKISKEERESSRKKHEREFLEMLEERAVGAYDSWRRTKREFEDDPRYRNMKYSDDRELLFRNYCKKLEKEENDRREQRKKQHEKLEREENALRARAAAALHERERSMRYATSGRAHARREDILRQFRSALVDLVRDADTVWRDVRDDVEKKMLNNSDYPENVLSEADKLLSFQEHVDDLYERQIRKFHSMLDEKLDVRTILQRASTEREDEEQGEVKATAIGDDTDTLSGTRLLAISFADLPSEVTEDPRTLRVSKNRKRLEGPWRAWLSAKRRQAREELIAAVLGNKFIDFHITQGDAIDLVAIHDVLKDDKRYLNFDNLAEERSEIIKSLVEKAAAASKNIAPAVKSHSNMAV